MTDRAAATKPLVPRLAPNAQAELAALYSELDAAVARGGAVCQLSGRCCRFQEYGHALYVSAIEVEWLLDRAPPPVRPLDQGQTCPWQNERGLCTARNARPLGCRVYFCDPAFPPVAAELSERFIARLRELTTRHGLAWNYAPLHDHLVRKRAGDRLEFNPEESDEA